MVFHARTFVPRVLCLWAVCAMSASTASADSFGQGANRIDIAFVTIAGSADDGYGGQSAGYLFNTTNIDHAYRIGVYEITNAQWNSFVDSSGAPSRYYNKNATYLGGSIPTNKVTWYEAARFVNWLNAETGHHAAYNFDAGGVFAPWPSDQGEGAKSFRHKDAFYYLPSEDEWVKAAYWNGQSLQMRATRPGDVVHQGDGVHGDGWNYYDQQAGYVTDPAGPWDVGSGSEELNGTYDMMGNLNEWMEGGYSDDFGNGLARGVRGGGFDFPDGAMERWCRYYGAYPEIDYSHIGFRVASDVPEPATLPLLALAGLSLRRRRWRRR